MKHKNLTRQEVRDDYLKKKVLSKSIISDLVTRKHVYAIYHKVMGLNNEGILIGNSSIWSD